MKYGGKICAGDTSSNHCLLTLGNPQNKPRCCILWSESLYEIAAMTVLKIAPPNFTFEVKRSDRRNTSSLQIRDGQLQVMVPTRTPDRQIRALVDKHMEGGQRKLCEQAARPKARIRNFASGEYFPYLGEDYQLCIKTGAPWPAEMINDKIVVTVSVRLTESAMHSAIEERLHEWYRVMALEMFESRTRYYSGLLGVAVKAVKIKNYKRRWGGCNTRGELSFNWRLILAPPAIIDYVAAHEVAHLVHHNHSPNFWSVVAQLAPTYRHSRDWLKETGGLLDINPSRTG